MCASPKSPVNEKVLRIFWLLFCCAWNNTCGAPMLPEVLVMASVCPLLDAASLMRKLMWVFCFSLYIRFSLFFKSANALIGSAGSAVCAFCLLARVGGLSGKSDVRSSISLFTSGTFGIIFISNNTNNTNAVFSLVGLLSNSRLK